MDMIKNMAKKAMGGDDDRPQQYEGYEQGGRPQQGYGGNQGYGGGQGPPPGYSGQGEQYGQRPQGFEGGYEQRPQGYGGGYEQQRPQGFEGGYGNRPQGYNEGGYEQRPQGYNDGGYEQRPQGGGGFMGGFGQGSHHQQQGGNDDDGFDWSDLGKMVSGLQGAQQQSGGDPSFHHFQNELSNQGHGSQINGGILDKLMGHVSHQTGSSFTGSSMQYQMMAKLASDKLGIPVPPQMLEKLMSWKDAGHF